ncbi:FAD/FMN-containing dehydrogenase [Tistlia consotensis]|uniref:FAD/FMN-containing dehydrogenase n=1 Tax=Tistlia consotensis USBA 355 TaxID=560819 RepID=A0A1Y6BPN7_9PROT|nr:FAD-binding oxidoreductase [Tistlia consotensis]SMF22073.1 FAD/FMN-containing dehydrogenase [Tistlia consotensis USBA 355]SNR46335.1 FAD/FMN-containing dehydrogenase [Tistlia consotensis]
MVERDGRDLAWGRAHPGGQEVLRPAWLEEAAALAADPDPLPRLGHGAGRSYGDEALSDGGRLIETTALDRFVAFDPATGRLTCEAGVLLHDILRQVRRWRGAEGGWWFPPVLPGTRFVTLGGAIANDVHGKNHHRRGTFGEHVVSLTLARSDGSLATCSAEQNPELFRATIGGLGLTGLILEATLQLMPAPGLWLECEEIPMADLAGFFALAEESEADWEYTAAWVDCRASGRALGRGVFGRARPLPGGEAPAPPELPRLAVPLAPPVSPLNRLTLGAFNALYGRRPGLGRGRLRRLPYHRQLFPLDAVGGWNRLYGRAGFYQYQCVVPPPTARATIAALLGAVAAAGEGSFLAVLKTFGARAPAGLLSFPMPGATLALDFPNRGAKTLALLDRLDALVLEAGGRVYFAKDGRQGAEAFRRSYPLWQEFRRWIDPRFASALSRRLELTP